MNRLVKLELLKIRSNATFWVLVGLHVGIVLLVGLAVRYSSAAFPSMGIL